MILFIDVATILGEICNTYIHAAVVSWIAMIIIKMHH